MFIDDWGWNHHEILPIGMIERWAYLLREHIGDSGSMVAQVEAMSCPSVFAAVREHESNDDNADFIVPAHYSFLSYSYSPTCFTSASAWFDPAHPPDVNTVHHANLVSSVRHPSHKTLLVEYAAWHDPDPTPLINAKNGSHTILAVDGHVEILTSARSTDPMIFSGIGMSAYGGTLSWEGKPATLLASRHGILGTDWR